jgi:hypothetical protein
MMAVFKITYPNGKIYVGQDRYASPRYFGSPDRHRRREMLWASEPAIPSKPTAQELKLLNAKEREKILELKSNDPAIGYHRSPKFRPSGTK